MIDLAALLEDPGRAIDLPIDAVPPLLLQCAALQSVLATRLATVQTAAEPATEPKDERDQWLTAEEADSIAHVGVRWLYRNWRSVGGARKFSPRKLRFHEPQFRRWLSKRS